MGHFKLQYIFLNAGIVKFLVLGPREFPGSQRNGISLLPQSCNEGQKLLEAIVLVFPGQQEHTPQAVLPGPLCQGKNLFWRHAIAGNLVPRPHAAV